MTISSDFKACRVEHSLCKLFPLEGGASLKYLVVQTVHKRAVKLPTYNLVSEDKIHKVIGEYLIPYGSHELKENWEERYENKNI